MFTNDCFLKFQGFHPSRYTLSYLNEKMSAIHEESPYGSTLQATFTRRGHLFKGVVTIHSSAGRFFAVASGNKLKEVTHKLMEQMRKRLHRWKSQRFQHESLKKMAFNDNSSSKEVNYDTDSVA